MLHYTTVVYIKDDDTGKVYSQKDYKRILKLGVSEVIMHDFYTTHAQDKDVIQLPRQKMVQLTMAVHKYIDELDLEEHDLKNELYCFVMNELEETHEYNANESEDTARFFIEELRKSLYLYAE